MYQVHCEKSGFLKDKSKRNTSLLSKLVFRENCHNQPKGNYYSVLDFHVQCAQSVKVKFQGNIKVLYSLKIAGEPKTN